MTSTAVEKLFSCFDQSAKILQSALGVSYLEALAETGENMLNDGTPHVQDNLPDAQTVLQLKALYANHSFKEMPAEEVRKGYQLALLKGAKEDQLQPNHQMTPDAIGFIMGYLTEKMAGVKTKSLRILDPAVGTGNLLSTIYNLFEAKKIQVTGIGVDIDDLLLALASSGTALQQQNIQLFHQDGLQDLLVDPVDIVVSDLPVGYYPNDDRAKTFEAAATDGHSYAHHLLIEQSLRYLKEGGYGVFLAPSNLFDSVEAPALQKLIVAQSNLQGIFHLPTGLFKNEASRKSIYVLQKKGTEVVPVKQVLLAEIPDLKNQQGMLQFMKQVEEWHKENK